NTATTTKPIVNCSDCQKLESVKSCFQLSSVADAKASPLSWLTLLKLSATEKIKGKMVSRSKITTVGPTNIQPFVCERRLMPRRARRGATCTATPGPGTGPRDEAMVVFILPCRCHRCAPVATSPSLLRRQCAQARGLDAWPAGVTYRAPTCPVRRDRLSVACP